ncbi:hypothetical protein MAM1_0128c06054 [Mucor ambiguus]|uniref:Uncharacterized protein n=1 Tax=Mucor ambiguus TaxID=91626 RepID=A0A0C9MWN1_9FUNG|nr:hypothetical protein MAM1_0128c06054 [Mucor ambiguus]
MGAAAAADRKNGKVDRWQSRYLGSVMGLDNLSSPVDQEARSACSSPLSERTNSPIMKRITKPFNSLLDSRRVTPSKSLTSPALNKRYSMSNLATNCGECHKKLSGKTVRLPDSQVKYHWNCLQCKGCQSPFQDTSFFIDVLKNVYHPHCAPSSTVAQSCSRCSQTIADSYIALNTAVLHPRCLRCTGCQKILHPASIYFDINGAHCQACSNEKMDDKELLSKHMKIVPQLQKVAATTNTSRTTCAIEQQHQHETDEEKAISPIEKVVETVKPSSLMSSRGRRPLPRFGVVRDCAGCNQRIYSVHEEIPGPKASRWHKKCLVCTGCKKTLDSGATVHEHEETHTLNPWSRFGIDMSLPTQGTSHLSKTATNRLHLQPVQLNLPAKVHSICSVAVSSMPRRALDELGLGSEMGPKLDGDETWQDHEMLDIVEWLNIVHFATGVAGEALLGLVDRPTRSEELRNDFWLPTIKRRRRFSSKEIKLLQKEFSINCNPCTDKVEEIADLFSTDKKIITTWFQNKRAKTKKLHANSPQTVSSVDDDPTGQEEQEQQEDEDYKDEQEDIDKVEAEEKEGHYDYNDTTTELSNASTDMDSDTLHVINGDTALTTPTCLLHQQEHQNVISLLSNPHYTPMHLSDYFCTYRFDLYCMAMQQDQDNASSFFTYDSSSTTHTTNTTTATILDLDENEDDATLHYELADSPSLWQ